MSHALFSVLPVTAMSGIAAAALGVSHFLILERATPEDLVEIYAANASQGNVEALRELGPPDHLDTRIARFGQAWHSRVEGALEQAAIAGAMQAWSSHMRYQEALDLARKSFYTIPWNERPEDRAAWIHDKAVEGLSDQDRALIYQVEGRGPRTYWNDIATAGQGAWNELGYREQRRLEAAGASAAVFARAGAWKLPPEKRRVLVALGQASLDTADAQVLAGTTFDSWAATEYFVRTHGELLAVGALRDHWSEPTPRSVNVTRPAAEGALFRPASATVNVEGLDDGNQQTLTGLAFRYEGKWVWMDLRDIDEAQLLYELEAPGAAEFYKRLVSAGGDL